jgi:DNA-binding transcriptional ArsR family regulator
MVTHAKSSLPKVVSAKKIIALRAALPAPEVLGEAAEVFRLLSNPVRLALMHALTHDELTVGDLARGLDLSLSVTSHQLALLRRMRLVAARDESRLTYYRASDEFVGHLVHDGLAHVGSTMGRRTAPHHHTHRVDHPRGKMPAGARDRRGRVPR